MHLLSNQIRKHKRILYDLFLTIENIILGNSFITRSFENGCNKYKIRSRSNEPVALLTNEETTPENGLVRIKNSSVELKGEEILQEEIVTLNEQTTNMNIKNLKDNIPNLEIFQKYSVALVSNLEINYRLIMYYLFVTIENIIIGASSVTRDVIDGIMTFKITSIRHQPTVIILYDLFSENVNNKSRLQLIREQEKHISEHIPYLWKTINNESCFTNKNLTALEATKQQEETALLNLVSLETVLNEMQENTCFVRSSSQDLLSIISSEYEEAKSDFTKNKLCFQKLHEIITGPPTFERGQNLNNGKTTLSNKKTEKETIASGNEELNERQKFHTGKENYNYYSKPLPELSKKTIPKRMHTPGKLYRCQFCERSFTQSEHKKIHERQHTGKKPYKGDYCKKTFVISSRKKCNEGQHTGEKPYKCDYCEKTFAYVSVKKYHERQHTGEKPYKCEYCEKTFARKTHKKRHERGHTGEKPYKCAYCEKTFTQIPHKKRHERGHTGEKPYKCAYCEKSFAQLSTKKIHERQHKGEKPYKCEYCEKIFAHLNSKVRHERLHTGEKPYKCEYCEKTFAQLFHKKIHERQHTGEKPYKCEFCEKTYAQLSSKRRHERNHTGEKPHNCEY